MKKTKTLFICYLFIGVLGIILYDFIPYNYVNLILEKSQFLLFNAVSTINLTSENPTKTKLVLIYSSYGMIAISILFFNESKHKISLKNIDKKQLNTLFLGYIFLSSFYILGVFTGSLSRINRIMWSGGFPSDFFILFLLGFQGYLNIILFQMIFFFSRLIKTKFRGN